MKRFFIGLFALALVAVFALPALAQPTLRLSGSYYAHGFYIDNQKLKKDFTESMAFTAQRFRLQPVFALADGVTVTTRFDAKEVIWGADRQLYQPVTTTTGTALTPPVATPGTGTFVTGVTATQLQRGSGIALAVEDENIGFDFAFATFSLPFGRFQVGYQPAGTWGTVFGDSATSHARIHFTRPQGPWTFLAIYEKQQERELTPVAAASGGYGGVAATLHADRDFTAYYLAAVHTKKTWNAGVLYAYIENATGALFRVESQRLIPFFRGTFGPLYVEAELAYGFGTAAKFYAPGATNVKDAGLAYYASARYTAGPLRIGALYAFAQGDDAATTDKNEGTITGGADFDPCLLLWNSWVGVKWAGNMGTFNRTSDTMTNASILQVNVGFAPSKKLDLFASLSFATANQKGTSVGADIGTEIDVQASYQIFGNLQYVVGAAYFSAGDWFRGTIAANPIGNNYLIQHRLNVTF